MIIKRLLERKYLIAAIFWTVTITLLSLISLNKLPPITTFKFKDKIIHFMFYFVFVLLWSYALKENKVKIFYIVVFAIAYGIIIEVLQSVLTTNREADVYDALANSFGACSALLILKLKKQSLKIFKRILLLTILAPQNYNYGTKEKSKCRSKKK